MRRRVVGLCGLVATDTRQKLLRYFLASAVNVVVAETILAFAFGFLHWSARPANVLAAAVAAIPAYWLARRWVWGRSGRSHLLKEVVPFWSLALVSLALTTWVAGVAERIGEEVSASRLRQTMIVTGSVFVMSGVLWVIRFFLLNGILFADRPARHNGSGPLGPPEPWHEDAEVSGSAR